MALTAKGAARREMLLAAALRVIEREGPAAVTHRSVATEASLPLAAATYYFASIDDLLVSAMKLAAAQQGELFASLADHEIGIFARELWSWVYNTREIAIAQYELMFLAMRRDALREDAEVWYAALEKALEPLDLAPERSRVAALAIDGLALRMLWRGEPSTVAATEVALRELLAL